jgi:SAM-dependent methyltransferase
MNMAFIGHNNDGDSFDFASKLGWEQFYQKELAIDDIKEWHSSIPLETIASYCNPTRYSDVQLGKVRSMYDCDILMIGCGISHLVDVILNQNLLNNKSTHITLLDSSVSCIDQLKHRYQDHPKKSDMCFVCGDAINLRSSLAHLDNGSIHHRRKFYDFIIDKGLMDAILCGDGWNTPIASLVVEVANALKSTSSGAGRYILVSYKLPKSTADYLIDEGIKAGLTWEFNCVGSNKRVSISIATNVNP